MLAASPLSGVIMRHRQSSETIDTHVPVKSTGAASRPDLARAAGGGEPNWAAALVIESRNTNGLMARSFLFLDEALVDRLDELAGLDEASGPHVFGIVVARRPRRLDLVERHLSADHVLNAVAHDHDHIPKFHDISFVTKAAMAGDDVGTAFLRLGGNREFQDMVEGRDLALHRAAVLDIEKRVGAGSKYVARGDHIGPAKQNDAVAIGVRVGLMVEEHGFAVHV